MIQRRPDLESDILSASKEIITNARAKGIPLSDERFAQAVAYGIGKKHELSKLEDWHPEQVYTIGTEGGEVPFADPSGMESGRGDPAYQASEIGTQGGPDPRPHELAGEAALDPRAGPEEAPEVTPGLDAVEFAGGEIQPAATDPRDTIGTEAGGFPSAEYPVPLDPRDRVTGRDAIEFSPSTREKIGEDFGKKEMPADKATKLLEDYVAEFKKATPKYEGVTEQERGWMILEAGLRVMAGQSPNAITNIAKGLQGLGPKMMEDAKERRAWNRKVDLSAAKYALEGVARDSAQERADARKLFFFYDRSTVSKDNPTGNLVALSMAEILDNDGKIPPNLQDKDLVGKSMVATAKLELTF